MERETPTPTERQSLDMEGRRVLRREIRYWWQEVSDHLDLLVCATYVIWGVEDFDASPHLGGAVRCYDGFCLV